MNKEELLNKAKVIEWGKQDTIPLLRGIFIVQQRKLHDSGYRLMYVIGHTDYDERKKDFDYYLISECSDVIDLGDYFSQFNSSCFGIHLDIDKKGIIHIWSDGKHRFKTKYLNLSNAGFEIV